MLCIKSDETITINPGDDIQSTIDKLDDGNGGRIIFNKLITQLYLQNWQIKVFWLCFEFFFCIEGTYTLSKGLIIYSNIAFIGQTGVDRSKIILTVDPNDLTFNEPLVTNDYEHTNSSNIWFENMSFL